MKKLTKSKVSDKNTKQQKISNFFNPSQGVLTLPTTSNSDRKPGQELCTKCNKRSPQPLSSDCSSCNRFPASVKQPISSKRNVINAFSKCQNKSVTPASKNCEPPIISDSSPDVILPTPPSIHKKRKIEKYGSKTVKRKFNFNDSCNQNKKKTLLEIPLPVSLNEIGTSEKCPGTQNKKGRHSSNPFSKVVVSPNSKDGKNNIVGNVSLHKSNSGTEHNTINTALKIKNGHESNGFEVNECLKVKEQDWDGKSLNLDCGTLISPDKITPCDNLEETKSYEQVNEDSRQKENVIPVTASGNKNECIEDLFLEDLSFNESLLKESVELEGGIRCEVISVEHLQQCGEVVLALKPCDSTGNSSATCVLRGSWADTTVCVSDVVCVSARPLSGQHGCWLIDDTAGLFVVQPDTLVSGTTIVGSLFCPRRSVLSDMYRGVDSDSSIMAVGSFLHELLQEVLKRKVSSLDGIKQVLNDFMSTKHFIFSLYASGMEMGKTKDTLFEFVPKIHAFVQQYIASHRKQSDDRAWNNHESWGGKITDVSDIEENIWAPSLGVKGKVDVTVKTSYRNKHKVMPLELKTGRASFSAEHRGQVILYTMMMSELGQTVDSGLLLYLREGVVKEVSVGPVERRDLIMLRNQLVNQLRASQLVTIVDGQAAPPPLPAPINHHSACSKCPYLTLCSAALKANGCNELSEQNPLQALSVASTEHLTMEHIVYVFHWTGLLRLEHVESRLKSAALQDIWTLPPNTRQKRGTCLAGVRLVGTVCETADGSYEHEFERKCPPDARLLSEGDYVIVSSDKRPAVAAGLVRHIGKNTITLSLERDLTKTQKNVKDWHLDKYESQSGLVFNMTNLGCLLDNTEQACRMRKAVIDCELPQFREKLSSRVLKASVDLVASLNKQQQTAIYRALAAEQYILIKGMPGTGKTATIVALVQLAVRLGLSLLITSHTHSAVDNVLLRLRGKVDFLRLGSAHRLRPELAEYGETGRSFSNPEDLSDFYNSKRVVAVTCLGSGHPLLSRRRFDLCVVDEATQVLQATVLRPLYSAHRFILIGDPDQLPPLVKSSRAKELGLGKSLFARLDQPAVTSELSLQYRMNSTITALANALTYKGKLECANTSIANATLLLSRPVSDQPLWVLKALGQDISDSIIVLDTGTTEAVKCANETEADIVTTIFKALSKAGVADENVGVIAPYRAQVDLLRDRAKTLGSLVEVNTVDQYQGRDKDVIIYSCTRSVKPTESDILGDKNRLTVAITRARHKLIIVGNVSLLRSYSVFNTIFQSISADCIVPIT